MKSILFFSLLILSLCMPNNDTTILVADHPNYNQEIGFDVRENEIILVTGFYLKLPLDTVYKRISSALNNQ